MVLETTANGSTIDPMQTETQFDQASRGLECLQKYVVDLDWLLAETTHEREDVAVADAALEAVEEVEAVRYAENSVKD